MPRIFDNIEQHLLPSLRKSMEQAERADFCVGYFNLRGWRQLDERIEQWAGGDGKCCRLLVGMQRPPEELLERQFSLNGQESIDNQTALRFKEKLAADFRRQLTIGAPNNDDEAGLRRLAAQLIARKVVVKLYLRHPLHAKLYLLFRPQDSDNPATGYVGSSNLTFSGLQHQGELNVDVLDHDACKKLATWFESRWNDKLCIDISDELAVIIQQSWAREELVAPFHIYVTMAYHLAREARDGLLEFGIPAAFRGKLFEYQAAAVKIAAHHINRRGGVVIGDVVGLGKTLMATAVAKIFEDDYGMETLIICPVNLESMWEQYRLTYGLRGTVVPLSQVQGVHGLEQLPRHRLVIIDESHNLRNREGQRYRAIKAYIEKNDSKVILLSATPYNKTYLDLSNQLRLFVPEAYDLGIRPERLLGEMGDIAFQAKHQCPVRSLAAFEKSEYADDWRELMRLYLVRRTRGFIQTNYAKTDPDTGRTYLTLEDGSPSYFPIRVPKTVKFALSERDRHDQYARLYTQDVVDSVNDLKLPRYGLGNYVVTKPAEKPKADEVQALQDLSKAGKRLMGFCRTNLFKRLESSGYVFLQSVERHILRNEIYISAIEQGRPLPIGTQDAGLLDPRLVDEDADAPGAATNMFEEDEPAPAPVASPSNTLRTEAQFRARAAQVYEDYAGPYKRRFKWVRPGFFTTALAQDLRADAAALRGVLQRCGDWDPASDTKLDGLHRLVTQQHPTKKVLVFTQFADTVRYLEQQLNARGVTKLAAATGNSANPTALAWRFSPVSNEKRAQVTSQDELRVLVATDVLSEGQNLQDCAVVVNYDLPWAIIRLIQRAGRVDRIGQQAAEILCYSFLPAEGVERIIRLRDRVRARLKQNAEVVGTDEAFFDDDQNDGAVRDLYNEKAGIIDGEADTEVDLASYAYQIWKNAIDADPGLEKVIRAFPPVVYGTRAYLPAPGEPEGVLVYTRTGNGNDALAWIDEQGRSVTESQFAILKAAACPPNTPAMARRPDHHALVEAGTKHIATEEQSAGGQLGRPSGARYKTYTRLKAYLENHHGTLFDSPELRNAVQEIYQYPLYQSATDAINRQLRGAVSDADLANLLVELRDRNALCIITEDQEAHDPRIICSMGLSG